MLLLIPSSIIFKNKKNANFGCFPRLSIISFSSGDLIRHIENNI